MSILIVRHGLSETNDRDALSFVEDGHLMPLGVEQAREMGRKIVDLYGVDLTDEVSVSGLVRTQETAKEAGFSNTVINTELNEVILAWNGLSYAALSMRVNCQIEH